TRADVDAPRGQRVQGRRQPRGQRRRFVKVEEGKVHTGHRRRFLAARKLCSMRGERLFQQAPPSSPSSPTTGPQLSHSDHPTIAPPLLVYSSSYIVLAAIYTRG